MDKDAAKTACLFVGTMIGAGFASGKEIVVFFGRGGGFFPVAAVCFAVLYCFAGIKILQACKSNGVQTLADFSYKTLGKGRSILDSLFTIGYLLLFATMIAGVDALAPWRLIGEFRVVTAVTCMLCFFTALHGMDGLIRANTVLTPLMLGAMTALALASLVKNGCRLSGVSLGGAANATCDLTVYVSMNLFLALGVMTSVGKRMENKIIVKSQILAATLLGALLIILGLAVFSAEEGVARAEIPMLALAETFGPWCKIVVMSIVWCGIFTTMISSLYPLMQKTGEIFGSKRYSILPVLLGYAISRLGFSKIVSTLYPAMGVVGAVAILVFLVRCAKR